MLSKGGYISGVSLSLQAGSKLLRDAPTAQDTAFLHLPRISLEDLQRVVMRCRNDEQLKAHLLDDYNLPSNFLLSCLRRGVATGNLLLLEHALKFNSMLPPDSSLRVDDNIILQLMQKAVTMSEMGTFQTILRSSRISQSLSMKAELLSLVILSAQFGNGDAVTRLCTLYPTCVEQTSQGRSAFVELSGAQVTEDVLTDALSRLLQMGTNINTQGPDGNTALHNAITKEYGRTAAFLIGNGACVNLPNNRGETPASLDKCLAVSCLKDIPPPTQPPLPHHASLYLAAEMADFESVDSLLAKRVPVDSMWIYGRTALSAAAKKGHLDMVRYLLSRGASSFPAGHVSPNLPVLHALRNGHVEIALVLVQHAMHEQLAHAADAERRHIKKQLQSLLHHSAATGSIRIAKEILSHPLSVVHPEVMLDKLAPLHVACRHGQLEMVKLFLAHKASPTIPSDVYGNTPFHYAVFYGHTHIAEYLLTLPSVEVNCTNGQLDTPLYCVLKCQLSQVERSAFIRECSVIFLLRHGATLQPPKHKQTSAGCMLENFSLRNACEEWAFVPEDTQKLIIVVRDDRNPLSLLASARLAVRGGLEVQVNEDVISKLGLPYRLQRYLLFKDRFPS